jgi:hypothetical protein
MENLSASLQRHHPDDGQDEGDLIPGIDVILPPQLLGNQTTPQLKELLCKSTVDNGATNTMLKERVDDGDDIWIGCG